MCKSHSHGQSHGHAHAHGGPNLPTGKRPTKKNQKPDFFTNLATFGELTTVGGSVLYSMSLAGLCYALFQYFKFIDNDSDNETPLSFILSFAIVYTIFALGSVNAHREANKYFEEKSKNDEGRHTENETCSHSSTTAFVQQKIDSLPTTEALIVPNESTQADLAFRDVVIEYQAPTPQTAKSPLITQVETSDYKATDDDSDHERESKGCYYRFKGSLSAAKVSFFEMKRQFGALTPYRKFSAISDLSSHSSEGAGVLIEVLERIIESSTGEPISLKARLAIQLPISFFALGAAIAPFRNCINTLYTRTVSEKNEAAKRSCSG